MYHNRGLEEAPYNFSFHFSKTQFQELNDHIQLNVHLCCDISNSMPTLLSVEMNKSPLLERNEADNQLES